MSKVKKKIFVVMPFSETPMRDRDSLTEFFNINLKERIESDTTVQCDYVVSRSDDAFDITSQIILDLYSSDIVICDLSGETPNPNVMYELGVRLSLSNKPTILIREANDKNKSVFDIHGFHIHEYSPLKYRDLENYLVSSLAKLEGNDFEFNSPILKLLRNEPKLSKLLSEERSLATLAIAEAAAYGFVKRLTSAFAIHLHEQSGFPLGLSVEECLSKIGEEQEKLSGYEWSHFEYTPVLPSGLTCYFNNNELQEYLDTPVRVLLNMAVMEYEIYFFGDSSSYLQDSSLEKYFLLTAETWHLMLMFKLAKEYCKSTNSEVKEKILANIFSIAKASNVYGENLSPGRSLTF